MNVSIRPVGPVSELRVSSREEAENLRQRLESLGAVCTEESAVPHSSDFHFYVKDPKQVGDVRNLVERLGGVRLAGEPASP